MFTEQDPFAVDVAAADLMPTGSAPLPGTVEVSIPGSVWGSQYGAVRITVPTEHVANIGAWLEAHHDAFQDTFDKAREYQGKRNPAPAAAPQAQAPAGPDAVRALANSPQVAREVTADGMMQVQGKFGPVLFPSEQAMPSDVFRATAVEVAAAELGIDASLLIAFDNRSDLAAGTAYSDSPGVIKFSKNASAALQQSVLTRNGKPGTVAWVSWDKKVGAISIKPTKEFLAASFTIAKLIAGGAT